jgi:hypothetical protein
MVVITLFFCSRSSEREVTVQAIAPDFATICYKFHKALRLPGKPEYLCRFHWQNVGIYNASESSGAKML